MPEETQIVWERDQSDSFFGQGYTLRVFSVPAAFGSGIVARCPDGYDAAPIKRAGVSVFLEYIGVAPETQSCFMRREKLAHEDLVVITETKIVHLATDR